MRGVRGSNVAHTCYNSIVYVEQLGQLGCLTVPIPPTSNTLTLLLVISSVTTPRQPLRWSVAAILEFYIPLHSPRCSRCPGLPPGWPGQSPALKQSLVFNFTFKILLRLISSNSQPPLSLFPSLRSLQIYFPRPWPNVKVVSLWIRTPLF